MYDLYNCTDVQSNLLQMFSDRKLEVQAAQRITVFSVVPAMSDILDVSLDVSLQVQSMLQGIDEDGRIHNRRDDIQNACELIGNCSRLAIKQRRASISRANTACRGASFQLSRGLFEYLTLSLIGGGIHMVILSLQLGPCYPPLPLSQSTAGQLLNENQRLHTFILHAARWKNA
ncbi:uncharacterized protein M421DRAFT_88592 [Didymella exigua CBS 183.55]|uniref:Uncharacterized protein n=1 Tax=Didymella exigua CBS 183.55 TaxID=1150837 RepID=A0A6A5S0P6_9PLEO|nr:uncharacterized protein M421DRAFT_88592 [Didymella exigua CBS 183.55]KAF1933359.1 hypothetical protein M421DRAFT_88592 [Didymella exigua CBS 183.55]